MGRRVTHAEAAPQADEDRHASSEELDVRGLYVVDQRRPPSVTVRDAHLPEQGAVEAHGDLQVDRRQRPRLRSPNDSRPSMPREDIAFRGSSFRAS